MSNERKTINSFGDEWEKFDFSSPKMENEAFKIFDEYFAIFDWTLISKSSIVADIGCGTGRWSRVFSKYCGTLLAVDASEKALEVAKRNLSSCPNCRVVNGNVYKLPIETGSLDAVFCLGVLHHIDSPLKALEEIRRVLKPDGQFLCYLYYSQEASSWGRRSLFRIVNFLRRVISVQNAWVKDFFCDIMAFGIYVPLANISKLLSLLGIDPSFVPLHYYSNKSIFVMRNDSRDRFGTPIELRFNQTEIIELMAQSGFRVIKFSSSMPKWVFLARKS